MLIRFIGTGTVMAGYDGKRSMACIAVYGSTGSGSLCSDHPVEQCPDFLLDCGHGAPQALSLHGIEPGTIGTILLTHNHMDHNAGIMPVIMGGLLSGRENYRLFGPEGTESWWRSACSCYPSLETADVEITELVPGEGFELTGEQGSEFSIETTDPIHSLPSLAYRITSLSAVERSGSDPHSDLHSVLYTGDTEPCATVAALLQAGDTLIHECSFPDSVAVEQGGMTNHTHPAALGSWLKKYALRPHRLLLTHLYPHCQGMEQAMIESVRNHAGNHELCCEIARDGLTIELH